MPTRASSCSRCVAHPLLAIHHEQMAIADALCVASSTSTQLIAVGDKAGGLHFFGSGEQPAVNGYSEDLG